MNPNHVATSVDPDDYPPHDKLFEAMDAHLHSGLTLTELTSMAHEIGDRDLVNSYRLIYEDEIFDLERRPIPVELYMQGRTQD